MEVMDNENKGTGTGPVSQWTNNLQRARVFGGLIVVTAGCLFLAREAGLFIPVWLLSWQMLLISIGCYVGIKHSFHNLGWLIMILVGGIFMIREFVPDWNFTNYLFPVAIIVIGLYIMVRPRRNCQSRYRRQWNQASEKSYETDGVTDVTDVADDFIQVDAVFGSIKKNIVSKNFKGGEINCVFAGSEVNLSQADIKGTVQLEVNSVFGGTRLIIPPHWELKSELTAVLGNVEDKRPLYKDRPSDGTRILVLKGAAVFGGIEIQSY